MCLASEARKEWNFVWIPCELSEYKKCNVWNGITQTNSKFANAWWETTVENAEEVQIKKYEGFYVGRFEAGLATSIDEYTTSQSITSSI